MEDEKKDSNEKKSKLHAPFVFIKENPIMLLWWLTLLANVLYQIPIILENWDVNSFNKTLEALSKNGVLNMGGISLVCSSLLCISIDFLYDYKYCIERKFQLINVIVVMVGFIILISFGVFNALSSSVIYQLLALSVGYVFSFFAYVVTFFPKNKKMQEYEDKRNYATEANEHAQSISEKSEGLNETNPLFKDKEE